MRASKNTCWFVACLVLSFLVGCGSDGNLGTNSCAPNTECGTECVDHRGAHSCLSAENLAQFSALGD
ncbi:MAG: hypothetical protein JW751_31375 [Polyangiaceae bacterium]|nr:hypothetical protein [Polyangiaceae bacterium]